jgi:hypothetical protein
VRELEDRLAETQRRLEGIRDRQAEVEQVAEGEAVREEMGESKGSASRPIHFMMAVINAKNKQIQALK